MAYDVTFGEIDIVSFQQDFQETVGSEYTLVGSQVLPGPPRPASLYSFTLNIHGDYILDEPDVTAAGFTKRLAIRGLLQDAATRYAGIEFSVAFDPDLDGWLVVGTADISYAQGGATLGEFLVKISNAVWLPAEQTIQAMLLQSTDLRTTTAPLDPRKMVTRDAALATEDVATRHYLPVGSEDVVGQLDPMIPELKPYRTIYGTGYYIDDRADGEIIRFDQNWFDVTKGRVRVFDRRGNVSPKKTIEGDVRPDRHYRWLRAFGRNHVFTKGDAPVLDNGRCRISWRNGELVIETLGKNKYEETGAMQTGYKTVGRSSVVELTPDKAVVTFTLHDPPAHRAEVYITLARGWEAPVVDIYHQGDRPAVGIEGIDAHTERHHTWEQHSLGVSAPHALSRSTVKHRLIRMS